MQVLYSISDLKKFLNTVGARHGCLADTGFLYSYSYDDDRIHDKTLQIFDILVDCKMPIYTNVIGRIEHIDLILRKQITHGAIEVYKTLDPITSTKPLFNLIKNINDQNTAHLRSQQSYKVDEGRIKNLRHLLNENAEKGWKHFCRTYIGKHLYNEWRILEEELGLNFVEVLEGQPSDLFHRPLLWPEMVELMALHGMRGPDAMILNMFSCSKFPLLITTDKDFEHYANDIDDITADKALFII